MSFFGRVFSYVFNELLVDKLANSRTFQKFAVRTDQALKEAQKTGSAGMTKQASEFGRGVWEQMKMGAEEVESKTLGKGTPKKW
mmetsp:Transcript_30450/g.75664  ORF Transcript_30450/g.75664 Transcript_30450/m.75664 type:complete len:84 (+) Transcript_30450:277-528(+)|eukprot:CAMPEP_0197590730 /NCGR_PEP_ID=MMETSP1326-20131121/12147_1 /TAXON_ID=1155430 /ORGANISM="Genus nov. species nov., Strain RCC2288" /LENGTH=83 /DNA_ID=CAMNT_0043155981 /DNA_START=261 /DNA_END=512 /DNA_ORIENTATION=+